MARQLNRWMGGQVIEHDRSDSKKWMSKPEIECKTSDQKIVNCKALDNKVVILIDSEGKHQIKQRQTPTFSKQPLDTVLQSTAILTDSSGRITLDVPCVGQEEIFHV